MVGEEHGQHQQLLDQMEDEPQPAGMDGVTDGASNTHDSFALYLQECQPNTSSIIIRKWMGRLGNHLVQLANAIVFAKASGRHIVQTPGYVSSAMIIPTIVRRQRLMACWHSELTILPNTIRRRNTASSRRTNDQKRSYLLRLARIGQTPNLANL